MAICARLEDQARDIGARSDQQQGPHELPRRAESELPQQSLDLHNNDLDMWRWLRELQAHQARLKVQPPFQRTLLQIEDDPANAELVEQLVARRNDLKLLTATDGYKGFEMAISHQPDVVLMDIRMPGINGHDAFVLLRKNPATAHIPVIALSSNAYEAEIQQCLNAGFFRYVTKPFNIVQLMAVIYSALEHGKAIRLAK